MSFSFIPPELDPAVHGPVLGMPEDKLPAFDLTPIRPGENVLALFVDNGERAFRPSKLSTNRVHDSHAEVPAQRCLILVRSYVMGDTKHTYPDHLAAFAGLWQKLDDCSYSVSVCYHGEKPLTLYPPNGLSGWLDPTTELKIHSTIFDEKLWTKEPAVAA